MMRLVARFKHDDLAMGQNTCTATKLRNVGNFPVPQKPHWEKKNIFSKTMVPTF